MRAPPAASEPGLTEPIPVFLLTGFLGSGKTTLLNRMLADGGPRTGIVVNEYGDVPIDNDLVQIDGQGMSLTTTSNGCICCTPGSDVVSALEQLSEALDEGGIAFVDRVVVETTGLADPAPIINQLLMTAQYRIGGRLFALAGVIATLDAVCGATTVEERYIGHKQLAFADRIALTKTDMLGHDDTVQRAHLHALVSRINPGAHLVDVGDALAQPEALLAPGRYAPAERGGDVLAWLADESPIAKALAPGPASPIPHPSRHSGIYTRSITLDRAVTQKELTGFIDLLRRAAGRRLLRLKGLVALDDDPERPMILHLVQGVFYPPHRLGAWPSEDRRTRLVLIADEIDETALDKFLQLLARPARRRRWRKSG